MLNRAQLIGNLGKDPETRQTQAGRGSVSFNLATTEKWKDKQTGEKKEKTEWHQIVIFDQNLCKIASQYLKKGSKVFIEGKIATRQYEKNGEKRYSTSIVLDGFGSKIVFLDPPRGNNNR